MEWDNESIVKQIQSGQGNRQELLERLWTDNLGLIRKIIHRLRPDMSPLKKSKGKERIRE